MFVRIAIVRSSFHRGSGQAIHISEIAKRLLALGHNIVVVSREVELKPEEIPIRELNFAGDDVPYLRNFIFPFRCLSFLKEFDIVHSQYHPDVFVGNVAKKMLGKPHVFTYHGFAPVRVWASPKQELKMIDHRAGTFFALHIGFDYIITVSHYLKKELINNYGIDKDAIKVIYNGIDAQRFNPNVRGDAIRQRYGLKDNPVILYIGRLVPYKGLQFLLRAIPTVLQEFPDVKFLVGGSMRDDMLNFSGIAKDLGIKNSVIFTGFVPDELIPELYACCDIFCYPSLWEGFGLTPGEAQASGKPVVAFNTCAIPEVVDNGNTGLLVEPRNHGQIAEAIVSLLGDEKLLRRMGSEGRKRVLRLFSWDKAVEETVKVYEAVLQ